MRSYRFYSLDRLGRAVERREEPCRDDADALIVANGMNGSHDIEVWHGSRQVARIPKRAGADKASAENEDTVLTSVRGKVGHG